MKEEDQNFGQIETEMIELVGEYIKENARVVIVAHQSTYFLSEDPKLIESISAYFKDLDWNVELVQYDYNMAIRLQRPAGFPFLQESNQEAPSENGHYDNQGRNVNMIQQSQDYQNQLSLNHCLRRKSQPSEDNIKHQSQSQNHMANLQEGINEPHAILTRFSLRKRKQKAEYIEVSDEDQKQEEVMNEGERPNDDLVKKEEVEQSPQNKKDKSRKIAQRRRQLRRIRNEQDSCQEITFKGRRPVFPLMEQRLAQWIRHMCGWRNRITQQEIRDKAIAIVAEMKLNKRNKFSASKGWLEKFLRRYPNVAQMLNTRSKKKRPDEVKEE